MLDNDICILIKFIILKMSKITVFAMVAALVVLGSLALLNFENLSIKDFLIVIDASLRRRTHNPYASNNVNC